jgi:hypothetical protein
VRGWESRTEIARDCQQCQATRWKKVVCKLVLVKNHVYQLSKWINGQNFLIQDEIQRILKIPWSLTSWKWTHLIHIPTPPDPETMRAALDYCHSCQQFWIGSQKVWHIRDKSLLGVWRLSTSVSALVLVQPWTAYSPLPVHGMLHGKLRSWQPPSFTQTRGQKNSHVHVQLRHPSTIKTIILFLLRKTVQVQQTQAPLSQVITLCRAPGNFHHC